MTWREAFLKQAADDYSTFLHLNRSEKAICQQLHYLQMATEKLAKAYLCSFNNTDDPPKTVHEALTQFLQQTKGQPAIRRGLGYEGKHAVFSRPIDSLLPFAKQIEDLAPEGKSLDKANPEYPWITASGDVVAPVDHTFSNLWNSPVKMNRFRKLVDKLIAIAPETIR